MGNGAEKTPAHEPARTGGWRYATKPLAAPEFRRVFASNVLFFMAMSGQGLVRPWLAFELTDSPLALGMVSAAVARRCSFLARLAACSRIAWSAVA